MNHKLKRFLKGLGLSFLVTVLWIVFLRATLIGLIYWYASPQFGVAVLLSMILPSTFFGIYEIRENEKINRRFFYSSLLIAIGILLFVPEDAERGGIGVLVCSVILALSFFDRRKNTN